MKAKTPLLIFCIILIVLSTFAHAETIRTVPKTIVDLHRNYPPEVLAKVITSANDYVYLAKADTMAKLPSKADFSVYKNADAAYLVFKKNVGKLVKKNIAPEDAVQAVRRLIDKFDDKIMEQGVEVISKLADKSTTGIKLTDNMADGIGNIIKYGDKANADAVIEMYDKEVAEAVFESAGKNMDTAINNAKNGKFSEKGAFLGDYDSVMKNADKYGAHKGRIFVTDPSQIDLKRIKSKDTEYLKELEGKLGIEKGTLTNTKSIAYVEIPNVKNKFIKESDGIPIAKHEKDWPLFLPNTGSTIGGMPERVINPMDVTQYIQRIKVS